MKEKISAERPRAFAAGYMLPFYEVSGTNAKKPVVLTLETKKAELLRDHRRMAFYTDGDQNAALNILDAFAADILVEKNAVWFKNGLSEESIRSMLRPTLTPEGFMMCRFSHEHFPKEFYINGRPVTDWEDMETRWTKCPDVTLERVVAELVCHGIYLKKQEAELLWKLKRLSVYTYEPEEIVQETNIDEHKEDIENEWVVALEVYATRVEKEIQHLERRIQEKRTKRDELAAVLAKCRRLSTGDPEWNTSIEYLRREINYFI